MSSCEVWKSRSPTSRRTQAAPMGTSPCARIPSADSPRRKASAEADTSVDPEGRPVHFLFIRPVPRIRGCVGRSSPAARIGGGRLGPAEVWDTGIDTTLRVVQDLGDPRHTLGVAAAGGACCRVKGDQAQPVTLFRAQPGHSPRVFQPAGYMAAARYAATLGWGRRAATREGPRRRISVQRKNVSCPSMAWTMSRSVMSSAGRPRR